MGLEVRVIELAEGQERLVYSQVFEEPDILKRVILALNKPPRRRKKKAEKS